MEEINFDGLRMKIKNENSKTGKKSEHEYTEKKDFERVFKIPVKPILKNNVEDKLIDTENENIISDFILPFDYEKNDVEEYKRFLANAFDRIREYPEIKLFETRKNKYQVTTITVEKI